MNEKINRTGDHQRAQICFTLQQFSSNRLENNNDLSAACLLAYANLLQSAAKGETKKTKNKKPKKKSKKNKKKQTHESNRDWVPWG